MDDRLILAGGFSEEEIDVLQGIDNAEVKILHVEDGEVLLQDLIANPTNGMTPLDTKMVVFHNFQKDQILNFLNLYRAKDLPRAIFAMVTAHSIQWKLKDLIAHLQEEDRQARK